MKTKTKNLTLTAILVAVMLLFGFTPIGYIPLGPVQVTLMCLPVIIGTLVLGLRTGFILGDHLCTYQSGTAFDGHFRAVQPAGAESDVRMGYGGDIADDLRSPDFDRAPVLCGV